MARTQLRTRTRRESMPSISPTFVSAMLLLGEFAAFAITAGQSSMVLRSFLIGLPLVYFIARSPVMGIYALTFLIPLELFARIPNEFFSLYKLLGVFTMTSYLVHLARGETGLAGQRTAVHRWVFAFLFFLACSLLWSMEAALTLQAVRRLASLAIFYFLVTRLVDSREKLRALVIVLIVSCVVAACFAIYAYVQGQAVFDTQADVKVEGALRASGLSLDANFFAATILTAMPFCLLLLRSEPKGGVKALMAVAAALIVLGTIYSFSRGGALTLGLVGLLIFIRFLLTLKGRALLGAFAAGFVALLIVIAIMPSSYRERMQSLQQPLEGDESLRGRWLYVEFSRESVFEHPLGVGAGTFPIAFRESRFNQFYHYYGIDQDDEQGRSAHNMYLEVAVETGFLGGILFLGIIGFAIRESVRTSRHLREKDDPYLTATSDAIGIALVAFAFAGLFLSAQYEKILWLLVALVVAMKNLAWEGELFRPNLRKLRRALSRQERLA